MKISKSEYEYLQSNVNHLAFTIVHEMLFKANLYEAIENPTLAHSVIKRMQDTLIAHDYLPILVDRLKSLDDIWPEDIVEDKPL